MTVTTLSRRPLRRGGGRPPQLAGQWPELAGSGLAGEGVSAVRIGPG